MPVEQCITATCRRSSHLLLVFTTRSINTSHHSDCNCNCWPPPQHLPLPPHSELQVSPPEVPLLVTADHCCRDSLSCSGSCDHTDVSNYWNMGIWKSLLQHNRNDSRCIRSRTIFHDARIDCRQIHLHIYSGRTFTPGTEGSSFGVCLDACGFCLWCV